MNPWLRKLLILLDTIKFQHSVFALPFALLAAFAADQGAPAGIKLVLLVACMVLVRTVAMSYNRLSDHDLDSDNPRTTQRALPAGLLRRSSLWLLLALAASGAIAACVLFAVIYNNLYPLILIVPLFIYICGYSHAKRFTWLSHLWLGSVLGLSTVGAAIAVSPSAVSPGIVCLFVGVTLWTAGFDVIYSLLDVDFDRARGLFSIPACFGPSQGRSAARLMHMGAVLAFAGAGRWLGLGWLYGFGLVVAAGLLVWEHRLARTEEAGRIQHAFFTLNAVLSIFLSGMGILDILL